VGKTQVAKFVQETQGVGLEDRIRLLAGRRSLEVKSEPWHSELSNSGREEVGGVGWGGGGVGGAGCVLFFWWFWVWVSKSLRPADK